MEFHLDERYYQNKAEYTTGVACLRLNIRITLSTAQENNVAQAKSCRNPFIENGLYDVYLKHPTWH